MMLHVFESFHEHARFAHTVHAEKRIDADSFEESDPIGDLILSLIKRPGSNRRTWALLTITWNLFMRSYRGSIGVRITRFA